MSGSFQGGGRPPNRRYDNRNNNRGARRGSENVTCYNCQQVGHISSDCPNQRGPRGGGQRYPPAPAAPAVAQNLVYDDCAVKSADAASSLATITKHAKDLIVLADGNDKITESRIKAEKENRGLRTQFGADGTNAKIATNYLRITPNPGMKLYIYQVHMIVSTKPNGEVVEVKNRYCRNRLLNLVLLDGLRTELQPLRDIHTAWATDYDLLWSIKPLPVAHNGHVLDTTTGLHMVDLRGDQLRLERMRISPGPVREIEVQGIVNGTVNEEELSIAIRGLNALMTKSARRKSLSDSKELVQTTANKFFESSQTDSLDKDRQVDMAKTVRALRGFFASVRPSSNRLFLNINTCTGPFFEKITVQEYYEGLWSNVTNAERTLFSPIEERTFKGILKGVHVTRLNGETGVRAIASISPFDIGNQRMEDGRGTVFDRYNGTNQILGIPGLEETDLAVNIGWHDIKNPGKARWFPARWLQIEEFQSVRGLLRSKQVEEMIKYGQKKPAQNVELITTRALSMFGYNGGADTNTLSNNGLQIKTNLVMLNGRFLQPPGVQYGPTPVAGRQNAASGPVESAENASWNLRDQRFRTPRQVDAIKIVNLNRADFSALIRSGFGRAMHDAFLKHGLSDQGPQVAVCDVSPSDGLTMRSEEQFASRVDGQLRPPGGQSSRDATVVVLRNQNADVYSAVRRVFDIRLGVQATCCLFNKVVDQSGGQRNQQPLDTRSGRTKQYAANVAMKCNLKVEGDNHTIAGDAFRPLSSGGSCDTLVLGADVAHPPKGASAGCPSIASVVGSTDDNFVKFLGSMRLQNGRQEHISQLWDMVKERLIDWAEKHNRRLPKSILFYRDGVSESQYDSMWQREIPQIQTAFELAKAFLNKNWAEYDSRVGTEDGHRRPAPAAGMKGGTTGETEGAIKPPTLLSKEEALAALRNSRQEFKLTYVVVGKRHNTRFYPTKEEDSFATSRGEVNGNVKPGLVVDQTITHKYDFDFYLQSQMPLAGTGRAAHYYVLTNQMGLSADQLQGVTHAFCYIYAKATRGVSYCSPAYYADKLCDRGRAYLRHFLRKHDGFEVQKGENEDYDEFRARMPRTIANDDYWNPRRNDQEQKYRCKRRNPWHPNLDPTMFYL